MLIESQPCRWQYGTYAPVKNNYNWNNLTNTIWVEQPAGTGFSSKGSTPSATSEEQVAEQFAGFWKNFIETFGLQHKKIYVTGESYAGFYVPCQYIEDAEKKSFANFTSRHCR
jgi:carboxypeptidase D